MGISDYLIKAVYIRKYERIRKRFCKRCKYRLKSITSDDPTCLIFGYGVHRKKKHKPKKRRRKKLLCRRFKEI